MSEDGVKFRFSNFVLSVISGDDAELKSIDSLCYNALIQELSLILADGTVARKIKLEELWHLSLIKAVRFRNLRGGGAQAADSLAEGGGPIRLSFDV